MARQSVAPGVGMIVEASARQSVAPGVGLVVDTTSAAAASPSRPSLIQFKNSFRHNLKTDQLQARIGARG